MRQNGAAAGGDCGPAIGLLVVARPRSREIRTYRGSRSLVRHTPIPFERIARAAAGHGGFVLDICADRRPKRAGQLARRVAGDHVAPEQISGRACLYQHAADVSADAVVFDNVAAAVADEAQTEIVARRTDRAVAAEHISA